jgi:hypothetical protein
MFFRAWFAAALLGASLAVQAQFPAKPIRVVVPFPAGSATDTVARVLAAAASQPLGQPVVVENKAGADGAIAAAEVAKSAPDGYTLLMATNSPMSAVPALKKNPPYDPVADFTPVTDIGRYTFFIVVHPEVPAKSLAELISYARVNPGKLNYATGNTSGIVSTAYFASLAKIELVHVPYKGEPQALTDLVAGHLPAAAARRQAARAGDDARPPQPAAARGADHRGSRDAAVLAHLVGGPVRPGEDAARGHRAPEPGIRRGDGPRRRSGDPGQAGLRRQPLVAGAASAAREGAARELPPRPSRRRRRARLGRGSFAAR